MAQLEIKPYAEFDERSRFEMQLAEISTFFINLPADRIDSEIEVAQRRVCEYLDLDRSALFQVPEGEPGSMLLTHVHQPPGSRQPPEVMNAKDYWPWTLQKILDGETITISKLAHLPAEAGRDRESFILYGARSVVVVPLTVEKGNVVGLLTFTVMREEKDWPETVVQQFKLVAQIFANALVRKQMENRLQEQLEEIQRLKLQLEKENIYLREEIELQNVHEEIVGRSKAMIGILAQVEQVARTDATVLIEGETGTGKELLARAVHRLSARKDRPLVTVNCASLPPTLIESELFGREKGAYTGALTRMTGRFEAADGATLFLDEIGELSQDVQAKLLRVLEHGQFERLGSTKPLHVNVRIIAASNRDLARDVSQGKFRNDLYYRLNVFPIAIPPLRQRPEDIPPLVWAFVRQYEKKMGKRIDHIPRKSMENLQHYPWPGNARELRNVIEHAMIVSSGKTLNVRVPRSASSDISANLSLEDAERRHILDVLKKSGWRLTGRGGAAEILKLKRTTLQSKMKKLGIRRPAK
jgi:transcriptional regulator with GAF, ATPase, and Fis domain